MLRRVLNNIRVPLAARFACVIAVAGCADERPRFTVEEFDRVRAAASLEAPPPDPTNAVADDAAAAHFGRWLYFETRLSSTGTVSCATCHDPQLGFTDGQAFALGVGPEETRRSAPTILNTAYNRWFFWDGRADSAWAQALGPIENPIEMGSDRLAVAHLIDDDPDLSAAYAAVFGDVPDLSDTTRFPAHGAPRPDASDPLAVAWSGMADGDRQIVDRVFSNVGKAIAAYERLLVMRDAPFDAWALSYESDPKNDLIPVDAQRGAQLVFSETGHCFACHESGTMSDLEFGNIGLGERDGLDPADEGRLAGIPIVRGDVFNGVGPFSDDPEGDAVTKLSFLSEGEEQRGAFKTPSLRNVALTAPYMHGGHFETLEEVVRFYSELDEDPAAGSRQHLLQPLELDDRDVADVVAFLESLTGQPLEAELLSPPASPVP